MKYLILRFGIIGAVCIILAGCAVLETEPEFPRAAITFDYTPPSETTLGSTEATFAVVKTRTNTSAPMFKDFSSSTTTDFEEILAALGYGVKGPFEYYNKMTDADKQESNTVLIADIDFKIDKSQMAWEKTNPIIVIEGTPDYYRPRGSVTVECIVNCVIIESQVSEILAKKSVASTLVTVSLVSSKTYPDGSTNLAAILENDNKIYSDLGLALETQYKAMMGKIYNYLNSDEVVNLLPKREPPRAAIVFDYTPSRDTTAGSADATFAIVGARFETPVSMFNDFASNMTKDFQEILTTRGYGIKGPFKTYDEMTYPDKEGSDLVLTADIDFNSDTSQLSWINVDVLYKEQEQPQYYRATGSVTVNCHVNLKAYESLTQEVMWTKSVAITPVVVKLVSHEKYPSQANFEGQLKEDNRFHADLGKALKSQYEEIMGKISAYLDPREMAIVKKQAQELRKKKVFQ